MNKFKCRNYKALFITPKHEAKPSALSAWAGRAPWPLGI